MSKKKVGVIVIGQAKNNAEYNDLSQLFGEEIDFRVLGLLDNLSDKEIKSFSPMPGEDYVVSTLKNGVLVHVGSQHVQGLLKEKLEILHQQEFTINLLFCTALFKEGERFNVIQPVEVIEGILNILKVKKLGIIVPEEEQIEPSRSQYERFNPLVKHASPYGSKADILNCAEEFTETNVDYILTDCMGFTKEIGDEISNRSGKPVIVPRHIVCKLIKALA